LYDLIFTFLYRKQEEKPNLYNSKFYEALDDAETCEFEELCQVDGINCSDK